jgi:hypothetical protein
VSPRDPSGQNETRSEGSDAQQEAPTVEFTGKSPPLHWPTLIADETPDEWRSLRQWVDQLYTRFPHAVRVPPCWWQHNDLVELLSALRDYERASYASDAAPTAAVDWHRAFREIESRMELWIKRFSCGLSGREHRYPVGDDGWMAFIAADARARPTQQRTAAPPDAEAKSPTVSPSR